MCPTGLGNPNTSCRFHRASNNLPEDNLCPKCNLELVQATLPEDQMTITIRDEADFDDPDLIERRGNWVTRQRADEEDASELQAHIQNKNIQLFTERSAKGEKHIPLTAQDNHGFVPATRKELSRQEREEIKAKIREDIIKFSAMEHK